MPNFDNDCLLTARIRPNTITFSMTINALLRQYKTYQLWGYWHGGGNQICILPRQREPSGRYYGQLPYKFKIRCNAIKYRPKEPFPMGHFMCRVEIHFGKVKRIRIKLSECIKTARAPRRKSWKNLPRVLTPTV